jgi:hypothetical protein
MGALANEIVQRKQRLLGRMRQQHMQNIEYHGLRVLAREGVGRESENHSRPDQYQQPCAKP